MDLDFQQLINKAYLVLPSVVAKAEGVYNTNFTNICELLYMVATIRLYDMSSVYLKGIENMDGAKMKTYKEFKKMQDERKKMLDKYLKKFKEVATPVL